MLSSLIECVFGESGVGGTTTPIHDGGEVIAEGAEDARALRPPKLFPLLQYLRDEIGLEYLPPNATLRQKQKDIYNFFQVPLGLEKVRSLYFPSLHLTSNSSAIDYGWC